MDKIIFEFPIRVAMEFAGRDFADTDRGAFTTTNGFFAPFDTNFGRKFRYVFVVFTVGPKFNLGARFFRQNFTNYGDRGCDVAPRPSADY